jgi:RHS repeat-associated protein
MGKTGTAFSLADTIAYGYNDRSEVTSAVSANIATYDYGYDFDPIGNRIESTSKETGTPVARSYTSNNLNQYTAIDNPTASPSYDDDGNMTSLPVSTGTWACTWDAENRLVAMEKATQRLEFKYDYASRRVEKKVFTGSTGNWTLDSHRRFVYDGFLQIEKLDGADSNALLVTRAWTGVEGYDRLIAETHVSTGNTYYVMTDANKNLTEYLTNAGAVAGHYEYSPFGQITQVSGGLSDQFDFRFSSEFFEQDTGLVYYNFRYYSPELGRWMSRDPIKEYGGWNLYSFVWNSPFLWWDLLGLMACKPSPHLIPDAEEWDRIAKERPPPDEGMTLDEYKNAVQESGETGKKLKLWEIILDKLRGATETISPKKKKKCPPCDPPPPLMEIDTENLFKDDPLPPLTPINPDDLEIIPRRRR